jgi:phage gp29-like protein
MLKDIASLLFGSFTSRAPVTFSKRMNPMHTLQSQSANLDVDFVAGCIQSAQQGDITRLLALYRDIESSDATIQGAINTRKLAVLARGFSVQPAPNSGEVGQAVADEVQAMLARSESFVDACTWLLHGCVWPVSVVNKRWIAGGTRFSHPEFRIVPLELYDYTDRTLRIKDVGGNGEPLTTTHTPDANRFLIHRGHMLMAPDLWGGPMRALVFWYLFSTQDREWWARFLERFGAPFLVGNYDKNDDDSRMVLERAFSEATRLFGVVATKETQISIQQAGNTSGSSDAFQKFHECAKDEKLMLILGQTLSSKASPTGLGNGASSLQGEVREDVKLWDAFKLANTVKSGVVVPWMRANGIQGPAPEVIFGGFNPADLAKMAEFLKSLSTSGLQLTDESIDIVSKQAGITLERSKTSSSSPPGFGGTPGLAPMSPVAAQLALAASTLPQVTLANESLASRGAAALSRAFSGELAPLAEIIASSRSRAEVIDRAAGFLATYRPHRSQEILAEVLTAHAANALVKTVE